MPYMNSINHSLLFNYKRNVYSVQTLNFINFVRIFCTVYTVRSYKVFSFELLLFSPKCWTFPYLQKV